MSSSKSSTETKAEVSGKDVKAKRKKVRKHWKPIYLFKSLKGAKPVRRLSLNEEEVVLFKAGKITEAIKRLSEDWVVPSNVELVPGSSNEIWIPFAKSQDKGHSEEEKKNLKSIQDDH